MSRRTFKIEVEVTFDAAPNLRLYGPADLADDLRPVVFDAIRTETVLGVPVVMMVTAQPE